MDRFLLIISGTYLMGAIWYYEFDWKNKKKVFLIPSEVLFLIALVILYAIFLTFFHNQVILVTSEKGYKWLSFFALSLIISVFLHMVSKQIEDRKHLLNLGNLIGLSRIHQLHGKISHNLIYISIMGLLYSIALLDLNRQVVYLNEVKLNLVLLAAILFAISFYRNIVHGRYWRLQLMIIPFIFFTLVYNCIQDTVKLTKIPTFLFTLLSLGLTFIMLATDEIFYRKNK